MKRFLILLSPLFLILLTGLWSRQAQTAVTLVRFEAFPLQASIRLEWETASELDNAGFYINRSLEEQGMYIRIHPDIIPAQGDGVSGAVYIFTDTQVTVGVTYYYMLESITLNGLSDFDGPIDATIGLPSTPTHTATATATASATTPAPTTPTGTLPSPTRTATRTVTQTGTQTNTRTVTATRTTTRYPTVRPPTATSRPTDTAVPMTDTPTPTEIPPTATLAPLPAMTLQFPAATVTATPTHTLTPSPRPAISTPTPTLTPIEFAFNLPLRVSFLGVVIILLWVLLGFFLYIYVRRVA